MLSRKAEVLAKIPLLASLTPSEMDTVAQRAIEKRFGPGEFLFQEGEECGGFFVLAQGRVKIVKTSPSGREIMLAVESAPSSVAEIPVFDGGPYPASVTALEDVIAYLITKKDFQQVLRQHPEVSLKILAAVGRRLRHLVSIIEGVTFGSVRQRLARTLLEFGEQAGGDSFPLPVTHQELASMLGTVREVVSRNLSRFQAEGLLRIEARQIHLLNREGLEREAETEMS